VEKEVVVEVVVVVVEQVVIVVVVEVVVKETQTNTDSAYMYQLRLNQINSHNSQSNTYR